MTTKIVAFFVSLRWNMAFRKVPTGWGRPRQKTAKPGETKATITYRNIFTGTFHVYDHMKNCDFRVDCIGPPICHSQIMGYGEHHPIDVDDFYYNLLLQFMAVASNIITLPLKPTISENELVAVMCKAWPFQFVSILVIMLFGHGNQFVPSLFDSGTVIPDTNRRE